MKGLRFHILFLFTLGFLLGNPISYPHELPIVHQVHTAWVAPTTTSVNAIAYNEVQTSATHIQKSSFVLPYSYKHNCLLLRHNVLTVLGIKKFNTATPIKLRRERYTTVYISHSKEEPLLA